MAGIKDQVLKPMGFFQDTTISAATALSVPDGATFAMIQAQTADVRWRDDGVDPTVSVGMVLEVTPDNSAMLWYTGDLRKIKFISATGGINVSFYA